MRCCPSAFCDQASVCQHGVLLPLDLTKKSCFWMKNQLSGHFSTQAGGLVLVDEAAARSAVREEG